MHLKPTPKLTPKIQRPLHRETRSYTRSFKEAKIAKKYKDFRAYCGILMKRVIKELNIMVKKKAFC